MSNANYAMASQDLRGQSTGSATPVANSLLRALSPSDYEKLVPYLEPVDLPLRRVLYEVGEEVSHVYFLTSGMASVVNEMKDGTVEVGTVGFEGMIGMPVLLGSRSFTTRCFIQVAGEGYRIDATIFADMVRQSSDAERLFFRYAQATFDQLAQWVACNRLHSLEARCARWLLMTADRARGETFSLTHEFLSYMLGVHRPAVSLVASELSDAGLIKYRRGTISVIDREGLEAAACACYAIARRSIDGVFEVSTP